MLAGSKFLGPNRSQSEMCLLAVERSDPKVHYFYPTHLTDAHKKRERFQEQAWIWDEGREMLLPSFYSGPAGLNCVLITRQYFFREMLKMLESTVFLPLIKMASLTKWKYYRGKLS